MKNGFSIVATLYRRRMGRVLQPGEHRHLEQWQAANPVNQRLADRLDGQRERSPDGYTDGKDFTSTMLHHVAVGALMIVMCSFFVALIWLVILHGH